MKKLSWLTLIFVSLFSQPMFAANDHVFAYTSFDEEIAQKYVAAFQKETGIKVSFVRLSTGEAIARIEAEKANPQASIWLGGVGLGHAEIKDKGLSVPYLAPAAASLLAKYRDPEGYWNGLYLGILSFAYNKDLLKKKNLTPPEKWSDLLDPKWKGSIQIPNPGTSGTSYNLITTLIARDGEDKAFSYLHDLHKNISQYTRSGSAPAKNVALGEALVGIGYAHDIFRLMFELKSSLGLIYPKDGTGYEVAAMSLIKGGKDIEVAKKLVDWSYTKTASQILADHYIIPLKTAGVKFRQEAVYPKDLKLIDSDINWAGKNKQRLIEVWNERVNH